MVGAHFLLGTGYLISKCIQQMSTIRDATTCFDTEGSRFLGQGQELRLKARGCSKANAAKHLISDQQHDIHMYTLLDLDIIHV